MHVGAHNPPFSLIQAVRLPIGGAPKKKISRHIQLTLLQCKWKLLINNDMVVLLMKDLLLATIA